MTKKKRWPMKKILLATTLLLLFLYVVVPPVSPEEAGNLARSRLASRGVKIPGDATESVILLKNGPFETYIVVHQWEDRITIIPSREEYEQLMDMRAEISKRSNMGIEPLDKTYEQVVAEREAGPAVFSYQIDTFMEAKTGSVLYVSEHY